MEEHFKSSILRDAAMSGERLRSLLVLLPLLTSAEGKNRKLPSASQRPDLVPGVQGEGESDCPSEPKRECASHGFDKPYQAIPKRENDHSRS